MMLFLFNVQLRNKYDDDEMTASLVDRIHIACFGEEMHQLAVGLLP